MEVVQREKNQNDQPSEESGSKTNGMQEQSQHEAGVEAATGPTDLEHVCQPVRTARTLRSSRDTQKGRSHNQSSIEDSIRRMQSSDRAKDSQARRGGKQNKSVSTSNRKDIGLASGKGGNFDQRDALSVETSSNGRSVLVSCSNSTNQNYARSRARARAHTHTHTCSFTCQHTDDSTNCLSQKVTVTNCLSDDCVHSMTFFFAKCFNCFFFTII